MSTRSLSPSQESILSALAQGPLSVREISDAVIARARNDWAQRHDVDVEWGTVNEPLGARLSAAAAGRKAGLRFDTDSIRSLLVTMERRGLVERIQINGRRPMLWRTAA